jgi:hypothetical protein
VRLVAVTGATPLPAARRLAMWRRFVVTKSLPLYGCNPVVSLRQQAWVASNGGGGVRGRGNGVPGRGRELAREAVGDDCEEARGGSQMLMRATSMWVGHDAKAAQAAVAEGTAERELALGTGHAPCARALDVPHTATCATYRRNARNAAQHEQPAAPAGAPGATPLYSMRGRPVQNSMCDMYPCATSYIN